MDSGPAGNPTHGDASPGAQAEPADSPRPQPGFGLLRIIGMFKLLKAGGLLVIAFMALHWARHDIQASVEDWRLRLHVIAPANRHVHALLVALFNVTRRQWELLAAVLFGYAVVFTVEGMGLILMKPWAEWMTIITTSGLLPFELWELRHPPFLWKFVALIINLLVVAYLVGRILRKQREHERGAARPSGPALNG